MTGGRSAFADTLSLFLSKQICIRVRQLGEVGRAGPGVQLAEERVLERLLAELRDFRGRVVHVAEDERFRRTDLLAGRQDFAVPHPPVFLLGVHARAVHALDAVVAFFHDALLADRDVRVREEREDGEVLVLVVVVEIETPHLVGAVVRAVLRSDAAVVGHLVDAFLAVGRGGDGADDFAGRLLAVHAHDGLVVHRRVLEGALVIAVDADPVHLAAAPNLILADGRDVVLRLAGYDAGVAARAGRQVHRETPGVLVVFVARIHADGRDVLDLAGEFRVLAVFLERARPHEVAPLHVEVVLRRGELVRAARLLNRGGRDPEARGRAEGVGIHAGAVADAARARAAVAKMQRHDVVGLAGQDPDGRGERRGAYGDPDEILVLHAEFFRRPGAHVRGVVPGQLRQRLRNFLQPPVVREAAVEKARVGPEDDFDAVRRRPGDRRGSRNARPWPEDFRRQSTSGDESVVKRLPEEGVEALGMLLLPVRFDEVEALRRGLSEGRGEHFECGLPAVQRFDERLEDCHGAVEGARVAPGLELVRLVHVPRTVLARLVALEGQPRAAPGLDLVLLVHGPRTVLALLVVIEAQPPANGPLLKPPDEAEVRRCVE